MGWEKYKAKFEERAQQKGMSSDDITEYLSYAYNLYKMDLPIIYDQKHLSSLTGYDVGYLLKATNSDGPCYRSYEIPKRDGSSRRIDEPLPDLKSVQRWILDNILSKVQISTHSQAYSPGSSILKNAEPHCCSQKILSLDITNFFGTINYPRVFSLFSRLGYNRVVTTTLSNLVTLENVLPQGAPTSPAISNIVALKIDSRLSGFSKKFNLNYTRYADDITFSGNFSAGAVITFVRKVIEEEGFRLNEKKTRVMGPHQSQEVTGIVTNKILQAPRKLRRELRQIAYYIDTYGLDDHLFQTQENRANYISHILGLASHVLNINPKDRDAMFLKTILGWKSS